MPVDVVAREFLANKVRVIRLVFDTDDACIISGEKIIHFPGLVSEKEIIKNIQQKFKVYYCATSSDVCHHVFNIRA